MGCAILLYPLPVSHFPIKQKPGIISKYHKALVLLRFLAQPTMCERRVYARSNHDIL